MHFEIGLNFPSVPVNPGAEYCCAGLYAGWLKVAVYLKDPDQTDVSGFNRDPLSYGIFEYQDIPILLLSVSGIGLEVPMLIDSFTMTPEERETVLASGVSLMAVFLINTDTNILEAIRTVDLEPGKQTQLRDLCRRQLNAFSGSEDVRPVYDRLIESVPYEEMAEQVEMVLAVSDI